MTLYELTKKYSTGKGEDTMWKTLAVVSKELEDALPAEKKAKLMREVYSIISTGHYNEEFANNDISKMYYIDKNGDQHDAPYWPESAVHSIYEKYKEEIPDYNCWDFAVTMNMIASDNWCMIKKWFPEISEADMNGKITEMVINWLKDPDWPTTTKIWDYLNRQV